MERQLLRPKELSASQNARDAERIFKFWLRTVQDFIEGLDELRTEAQPAINRKRIIISCLSSEIFPLVEDCETYEAIVTTLKGIYVKRKNNVFARHLLVSRNQAPNETVAEYLQALKELAKDCTFTAVTADVYQNQLIRDSFIKGLTSPFIRQRLLENDDLTLTRAVELAETLDRAQHQSNSMGNVSLQACPAHAPSPSSKDSQRETSPLSDGNVSSCSPSLFPKKSKCYFCDGPRHVRNECPARNCACYICGKRGHFAKSCKSARPRSLLHTKSSTATVYAENPDSSKKSLLAPTLAGAPSCLRPSIVKVRVLGEEMDALIDSGASENFIHSSIASKLDLPIHGPSSEISMASGNLAATTQGRINATLTLFGRDYHLQFCSMNNLCSDVILGLPFLQLHRQVSFVMGGPEPPLHIDSKLTQSFSNVAAAKISAPPLFQFLSKDCKPVATRSRQYNKDDQQFIMEETRRLLDADIIEPSRSPWRAQVLVVKQGDKKRLVIDYSSTINRFTRLDAYPLPRMETIVNQVAQDKFYSSIDLRAAYHQIPIKEEERIFTSFEADGRLYQYKRLPFGVVNGVSAFQRAIDEFISRHNLKKVYAYLDDITVTGATEEEHDQNLKLLLDAAKSDNLTLNQDKSKFKVTSLCLLGYLISHKEIKPDPRRLQALLDIPPPETAKELKRINGLFAYYSRWIDHFSEKASPLLKANSFPLSEEALKAFQRLKSGLSAASLGTIKDDMPFEVETDASDISVAAILSQQGRPVAFMSRTLNVAEKNYPAVEKEATAIMDAVRKWSHFLKGKHFTLVTDQKSITFMFSKQSKGKIKNSKLLSWRIELSQYSYDIRHKPGQEHIAPDALSRICSAMLSPNGIFELHKQLGHPGYARLYHFVKSRNLPFTSEATKETCRMCKTCAEVKPRFHKPPPGELVKATQAFQRLSIDFKGPVRGQNSYLLIIVDEYSRYPFVFPCRDMTAGTVIKCLDSLFVLFGFPAYIHSDRGSAFLSREMKQYLSSQGIASSNSSPYHPQGNSQCERVNQTIWRTVKLLLHEQRLSENHWEEVLNQALHCVRSLVCLATNETPHERMFRFPRKAMAGSGMPTWLLSQGPVLLRRFVRNKDEPLCDQVLLLDANQSYARIQLPDGRESTVSTSDLAPCPRTADHAVNPAPMNALELEPNTQDVQVDEAPSQPTNPCTQSPQPSTFESTNTDASTPTSTNSQPRRSGRVRRPPERYGQSTA